MLEVPELLEQGLVWCPGSPGELCRSSQLPLLPSCHTRAIVRVSCLSQLPESAHTDHVWLPARRGNASGGAGRASPGSSHTGAPRCPGVPWGHGSDPDPALTPVPDFGSWHENPGLWALTSSFLQPRSRGSVGNQENGSLLAPGACV